MSEKIMMIDSEEGLMSWCRSTGSDVRLQKKGAKIILEYLTEHGKTLSTNSEGDLYINDEIITEKTTIDDVVDMACEWNYEALSDARDRKDDPADFLDFCRSSTLVRELEEHKFILDRIFRQTIYGRDVTGIAHKLAVEMINDMHFVPVYDIPVVDGAGACGRVSENHDYSAEGAHTDINEYSADIHSGDYVAEDKIPDEHRSNQPDIAAGEAPGDRTDNDKREEQGEAAVDEKEQGRSR